MSITISRSAQLYERACEIIPGGVNSPVRAFRSVGRHPIYIRSAAGSHFTDVDGNEFVDFCQSWGPLILGHAHPAVVAAVCAAASQGLSYGACHEKEIEIAALILEGCTGFDSVRLVSSGTEAVMTALRLARGATGRDLVLKFEGGYHGHVDAMLVKAGSGLVTQGIAGSAGIPAATAQSTIVAQLDDEASVEAAFKQYGSKIAAIIIEPLPANNGLLAQRREFLAFLREVCTKYGALLIFDEVISGFRLHFGGYYSILGIQPDMVTLGKIIGGGMPVGAIVGMRDIMRRLAPVGDVYQAGTLSGNPVALAAGITTLSILKDKAVYAKIEALGRMFAGKLIKCGKPHIRVQQEGSIVWLYLDDSNPPRRPDLISLKAVDRFNAMYWQILDNGYYLPPSAYEVLFISAAHTDAEVAGLADEVIKLAHQDVLLAL
jgi:glutamate-1-semialdehyde 2,1-aminomutase